MSSPTEKHTGGAGTSPTGWVVAGAAIGGVIGTIFAFLHSAHGDGTMFIVELQFLAIGFAMIGSLAALILATPSLQGWGEGDANE